MATTTQWEQAGGTVNLLTTELNSLANNTGVVSSVGGSSGVYDNTVGGTSNLVGYTHAKLMLLLKAGAAAWTAGGCVKLWFLETVDGTNYEYYTTSAGPTREPDAVFFPAAITTDQYVPATVGQRVSGERPGLVELPPGTWKVFAMSVGLGQAMASSANTVVAMAYALTTQP